MTTRNPKQLGTNLFDCKPQVGLCPNNCNQCFYNREGAFYTDINKPQMPTVEEVGEGIVRVNAGHDSNVDREYVIQETEIYKHRFFNTSIGYLIFPAPVVLTVNPIEEAIPILPTNFKAEERYHLMFVRIRVSSSNVGSVMMAAKLWSAEDIPVVLTFMRYYDVEPPHKDKYEWKQHVLNSYWCPTREFQEEVLMRAKLFNGRLVTMCGTLDSSLCKDCRNCETYYWQAYKRMKRVG